MRGQKAVDRAGKKYGRLFVIRRDELALGRPAWICRCDCGIEKSIRSDHLASGRVVSCGCYSRESTSQSRRSAEVPIGSKFGMWTVVGNRIIHKKKSVYPCRCACGAERNIYACHLGRGMSQSCGCIVAKKTADRNRTHGMSHTPEYGIWRSMIDRCHYLSCQAYDRYGGRGIFVCDEWRHSFENFIAHMGKRPSDKHSIDRMDNNKGYAPGNCRWATDIEQARNKRSEKSTESGVAGVNRTNSGKWIARIGIDGAVVNLGIFDQIDDAVNARKRAEKELWQTA